MIIILIIILILLIIVPTNTNEPTNNINNSNEVIIEEQVNEQVEDKSDYILVPVFNGKTTQTLIIPNNKEK